MKDNRDHVAEFHGALIRERDTLRKLNKESCEMAIKAYEERDALQARLDEAVELLRRYLCDLDSFSETQRQIDQAAHAFLTLHTPKGGK